VPAAKLNSSFEDIEDFDQLPKGLVEKISHFFEHYKDLEKGKWVKIAGIENAAKARQIIKEAIDRV